MSIGPIHGTPSLAGADGELVSVRIAVEPRHLERLLDILARLDFPINPQLYHSQPAAIVEFPAWRGCLSGVEETLAREGFPKDCLRAVSMLEAIEGGGASGSGFLPATA